MIGTYVNVETFFIGFFIPGLPSAELAGHHPRPLPVPCLDVVPALPPPSGSGHPLPLRWLALQTTVRALATVPSTAPV